LRLLFLLLHFADFILFFPFFLPPFLLPFVAYLFIDISSFSLFSLFSSFSFFWQPELKKKKKISSFSFFLFPVVRPFLHDLLS